MYATISYVMSIWLFPFHYATVAFELNRILILKRFLGNVTNSIFKTFLNFFVKFICGHTSKIILDLICSIRTNLFNPKLI